MTRPSKFQLMRANRRTLMTARVRAEARDLGYDPTGEFDKELDELAEAREALLPRPPVEAPKPLHRWWMPRPWRTA